MTVYFEKVSLEKMIHFDPEGETMGSSHLII